MWQCGCKENLFVKSHSNDNSGHDIYTFFNQRFDNGVNEGLSWFGINLIVSFEDITQNMFCILAKI